MKVIMLTGAPDTGKTTVLKELYKTLKADGAKDIIPPVTCPRFGQDNEYCIEYKGKKIGIVTIGDFATEIIWYLGVFFGRGADILVIANSDKNLQKSVLNHHNKELQYDNVPKTSIYETGIVGQIMAKL